MSEKVTRTYEITGYPAQLDILEKVFGRIEYLGSVGSSRKINIFVDGDGAVRLKIRKSGKKLNHDDGKCGCGTFETDNRGNVIVNLG